MKHFGLTLIFIYIFFGATIYGKNVTPNKGLGIKNLERIDSIANSVKTTTSSSDKSWIDSLLKESIAQRNIQYQATAYYMYVKYFYVVNPDSMRFYSRIVTPFLIKQKRWEELFRIKGWNIFAMINEGKESQIISAINQMKADANKYHFNEGEEMADQALAFFYFSQNLPAEGEKLYKEVLVKMEERNAPLGKRFNILRQLLSNENPQDMALRKLCIQKLKEIIAYCEKNQIKDLGYEVTLESMKYLYYKTLAIDAAKENKMKTVYENLRKIQTLKNAYETDTSLFTAWLKYYKESKQYEKGLLLCEKGLQMPFVQRKIKVYLDLIFYEAEFNKLLGEYHKACELYSEYITKNDSITSAKYYSDLAKLRNQHDIDNLALQNKKMELKATKDHSHMIIMKGGILFLVLICCAFGYISYTRNRHSIQLKKAKEKAEESDRLKSAFLANMNHEIRTPLNAIVGFSQVLIDEDNKENRAQYAKIIQSNNELLQQLIYDVLDLSKIESNTMQFTYKNVDLKQLTDNIFSATSLRMPEDVRLLLENDEDMTFYTDPNRLTQILTNLLNNAIKHTQQGFIRFGFKKEMGKVTFFVEDTGEGIPADKLDTIFARFVQLKDMDKGVGLGLAICKGLVAQMDGTISVRSTFGKGSTFTVILPTKKTTI